MISKTLAIFTTWLATASAAQIAFVDAVYAECEKNYENGGGMIVECYTPDEIVAEFETLSDVRELCGLLVEQALNTRWGEDNDPEVGRADRFRDWGNDPEVGRDDRFRDWG